MTSRLVNLLTFGLAGKRDLSLEGLSSASSRRISTLGGDGTDGDYSSYSNHTSVEAFRDQTDPALSAPSSQPPSPDPHEAYILPPSFPSPSNAGPSSSTRSHSPGLAAPHYSASSSSLTPVLTGDATLDIYKTELDLLSREVDHIRGSVSAYAKQLIRMGLQATDVAEKAYDVCEAARFFPAGMKVFMKVHRGWSEEAAYLFAGQQLEEEVLRPLKDWDERVDTFVRELMRVNQVRLTMNDHKKRVDALFLRKCDAPKAWTDDEERELRISKSDLEATCNHYTGRCEGLVSHWKSLALGRMNALDMLFTRLMTQQYALFQPALHALNVSGIGEPFDADGGRAQVSAENGVAPAGTAPTASPLTPPTPSGRLRAYSGDGLNVRKRSHEPFEDGERGAVSLLNHFSAPRVVRKREADRQKREKERREREEAAEDHDDDRQDALLQTLELMKTEIREKERLQQEMETLLAEQKREQETRKEEESEEAQRLRERLQELERRLDEKERLIAREQKTIDDAEKDGVVVGQDAPPPPPLDVDVPSAPPMDDVPVAPPMDGVPSAPPMFDVPPAPDAPMAPAFGGTMKKMTPRDKEIAEAKKYHLPLLPAMQSAPDVSVKRLHWSTVAGADVKGTVWEELFTRQVEGQQKEVEDWEAPLVKKEPDGSAAEDASLSNGDAGGGDFEWQWPLGAEFGATFSQKAAKAMAGRRKKKKRRSGAASTTAADESNSDSVDDDDEARALREASEAKLRLQLERVELIDAKRAYNVSISLSHFRLDYPLLRNAVMTMDPELLSLETLEVLQDILPTAEEVQTVKEYDGDVERLGDVERFFLCMSVPTLSTRLRAFVFLQSFSSVSSGVQDALDVLHRVNGRLRDSKGLKAVLGIVLRMGNYMTASNGQPQVYGFHLSTLLKLRGVKSVDNRTTLLHFLVHYVHERCPQVKHAVHELQACRAASRVESAFLVAEVKQLQQNVRLVKQLIDDDARRRGAASSSRFAFPPNASAADAGSAAPGPLFSPLSAPSITPFHRSQPLPSPDPSHPQPSPAQFSFSQELPTPASAMAGAFPADSLPPLPERLYTFYAYAKQRVAEIEGQLAGVQAEYAELQRLFMWEDGAWESLYAVFGQFADEWAACEHEMDMARQAELRRRRQQETADALQRKRHGKDTDASPAVAAPVHPHNHKRSASSSSSPVVSGEWESTKSSTSGSSRGSTPPTFSLEIDLDPADDALP